MQAIHVDDGASGDEAEIAKRVDEFLGGIERGDKNDVFMNRIVRIRALDNVVDECRRIEDVVADGDEELAVDIPTGKRMELEIIAGQLVVLRTHDVLAKPTR